MELGGLGSSGHHVDERQAFAVDGGQVDLRRERRPAVAGHHEEEGRGAGDDDEQQDGRGDGDGDGEGAEGQRRGDQGHQAGEHVERLELGVVDEALEDVEERRVLELLVRGAGGGVEHPILYVDRRSCGRQVAAFGGREPRGRGDDGEGDEPTQLGGGVGQRGPATGGQIGHDRGQQRQLGGEEYRGQDLQRGDQAEVSPGALAQQGPRLPNDRRQVEQSRQGCGRHGTRDDRSSLTQRRVWRR